MDSIRLLVVVLLGQGLVLPASVPLNEKNWKAISGVATVDLAVRHDRHSSIRLQPGEAGSETKVELPSITLLAGKNYVLTGWVRTSSVAVEDRGRSPIAIGAAISMVSMPFDVHSASLAGTRDWTQLRLPFTAASAKDAIVMSAGSGGVWHGDAWFADLNVEGPVTESQWPSKAALQTFGPAYGIRKVAGSICTSKANRMNAAISMGT